MGFRNFGSLLIVFVILMMVFGTHKLRNIGNDLAVAIKSFRKGLQDDPEDKADDKPVDIIQHTQVHEKKSDATL